jgi:hypothetical protein
LGKERQELKWVLRDLGEEQAPGEPVISPGPTRSILDTLEIGGGRSARNMLAAARTVDQTLSYPKVAGEPKIEIRGTPGRGPRNATFWRRSGSLVPSHITVAAGAVNPISSVTHELGHYLDSLLGQDGTTPAKVGGVSLWRDYSSEQARGTLQPVLAAVKETEMYRKLDDYANGKSRNSLGFSGFRYGGRSFAPGKSHVKYLLKPPEVVARSFEQYIAAKNPDSELARTPRHIFSASAVGEPEFPGYMKGQDLENVNRVWDQVLDQRGLLKKRDEGRMAASAT